MCSSEHFKKASINVRYFITLIIILLLSGCELLKNKDSAY